MAAGNNRVEISIGKVILLGDEAAGKTCLLQRYKDGSFSSTYKPTLDGDFKELFYWRPGVKLQISILDAGIQSRRQELLTRYAEKAAICILVFDITNRSSFIDVSCWPEKMQAIDPTRSNESFILVGTKSDLVEKRTVTAEEAEAFATTQNFMGYLETSAKDDTNVTELFETIGKKLSVAITKNAQSRTQSSSPRRPATQPDDDARCSMDLSERRFRLR